ncbi:MULTISPECIES: glycine cleavage system protein GcvH [unclassified Polynucleobacter]|uniref:glycine cleavage system protein GcvH n=1 Tax=unclassified Polynucleobacter TaxID=2640945 RepID=UPI0009295D27|nr:MULTISPECIES: glycine cleavage system protein GcvH [unclassified Polynucleobacter]MBU3562789.1 glycine cleavage system protein GcvH [Polynucleobacter sp. Tro8-14-1]MBU3641371.1 glycine cleavage system protein GcvH [Polynucleobacter sp. Fuers-14]OJI06056.1 glycine cleavage system protein H [Polynucleobacter sp. MWH-Adler-W8]QWD81649.1 glycine cleavage system protein GcvH [Polynucleobacter sp. MWH-S4W17]
MNSQDTFKFAETHEWADQENDGLVWVGISNHAQEALGDVMFFQAPKLGQQVKQGEAIAVIESVKAASDIHAPVSGEIVALNEAVDASPEIVNENPYGVWLFKIKPASDEILNEELNQLLTPEIYNAGPGA